MGAEAVGNRGLARGKTSTVRISNHQHAKDRPDFLLSHHEHSERKQTASSYGLNCRTFLHPTSRFSSCPTARIWPSSRAAGTEVSSTLEVPVAAGHRLIAACGMKSAKCSGTEVGTTVRSCLRETYPARSDPCWWAHLGPRMFGVFKLRGERSLV